MNQKIATLYEQASVYAFSKVGYTNETAGKTIAEVVNEKFAELIILECAAIAKTAQKLNKCDCAQIPEQIKKQMGLVNYESVVE